jgi:hypothetical protein
VGFESYRYTGLQLLVAGIWVRRGYHLPLPEGLPPEYRFLEEEDFAIVYPSEFVDIQKFLTELRKGRKWLEECLGSQPRKFHGILYLEEDAPYDSGAGFSYPGSMLFGLKVENRDFFDIVRAGIHELAHLIIFYHPLEDELDAFCSRWTFADWHTPEWERYHLRRELEEAIVIALVAQYFGEPLTFGTSQRLNLRKELVSRPHAEFLSSILILVEKATHKPLVKILSELLKKLQGTTESPGEAMVQFFATILPRRFRKYLHEEHLGHGRWRYTVQPGPVQPEG